MKTDVQYVAYTERVKQRRTLWLIVFIVFLIVLNKRACRCFSRISVDRGNPVRFLEPSTRVELHVYRVQHCFAIQGGDEKKFAASFSNFLRYRS